MPRKLIPIALAIASLPLLSATASAQTPPTQTPPTQPAAARYSVETTLIGTLLDDPAAAAVLERMIPTIYANEMFRTMGRMIPLKGVQQYESNVLTDEMLGKIQAEFDALPVSK